MKYSTLLKGLVGHWRLDALTGATDLTPYGNNGTANGGITIGGATDRFGIANRATSFNGSSNYVSIPDATQYNFGSYMSAFAWIKGGVQVNRAIFSQWDTGTDKRSWYFASTSSSSYNKFLVGLSDNGTWSSGHNKLYWSNTVVVFDNSWHNVGFTWNNGNLKLYIDGVEDTDITKSTDNAITTLYNSNVDLTMGCWLNNNSPTGFFTGSIDDPRLYNRALSATEVLQLYQSYRPKLVISGT